jgi:hypothetical protein
LSFSSSSCRTVWQATSLEFLCLYNCHLAAAFVPQVVKEAVGFRIGDRCVFRVNPIRYLILYDYFPKRVLARRRIQVVGHTAKNPVLFLDFAYRFIYSGQKWVKVEEVSGIPSGK